MQFPKKRRLYESLPDGVKRLVGWIPFRLLAGRAYRRVLSQGAEIDKADRGALAAYQESALRQMLRFACDQVPAYFAYRGLVDRLPAREALNAFPFLDKAQLQDDLPRYLPRDFEKIPHYACTTGGTSGNQLQLFVDDHSQAVEMAFMHRQWARIGYRPSQRKATFRGLEFGHLPRGVFWQLNPVYNELQFSPFHMNENTLHVYWKKLLEYQPRFLHGYPSAISLLADFLRRHQIATHGLRLQGVLLGSEALTAQQRLLIEDALHTRAFCWYGHSERLILAGECETDRAYHHFPDYGILEIIDADGQPIDRPGEAGELVGTGLLNRSLPLIRYRTGDLTRRLDWHCSCGRAFDRFDEVQGRWQQEYVIGRNGSRISLVALNMHGPLFDHVVRYQYCQRVAGSMEVKLMVSREFAAAEEAALLAAFRRKTGDELDVDLRRVDEIPLTSRGKFRRLVQEIPPARNPSRGVPT